MTNVIDNLDPDSSQKLASLIRQHADELAGSALDQYRADYPFSTSGGVNEEGALRWAKGEVLSIADQLETRTIEANEYEGVGGDMVLQHERLLYPIDAFLESCLFFARLIAQLVWRSYVGDTRMLNRLLSTLEAFTQAKITRNLACFSETIEQPRVLIRTWQLGETAHPAEGISTSARTATETVASERDPFDSLTPHEREMATLVAQGKSNAEVASALGVRLSTVKNTMSRIYSKLGISSRVELVMMSGRAESAGSNHKY